LTDLELPSVLGIHEKSVLREYLEQPTVETRTRGSVEGKTIGNQKELICFLGRDLTG
jgi:hypothetical protein